MKKPICLVLVAIFLVSVPVSAYAATSRDIIARPNLSFDGTTAKCVATVIGDTTSEVISVTVKLWYGSTCLQTWTATGNGYVALSKTATVTAGRTYTMTVDVTINGVAKDRISKTGTCS